MWQPSLHRPILREYLLYVVENVYSKSGKMIYHFSNFTTLNVVESIQKFRALGCFGLYLNISSDSPYAVFVFS